MTFEVAYSPEAISKQNSNQFKINLGNGRTETGNFETLSRYVLSLMQRSGVTVEGLGQAELAAVLKSLSAYTLEDSHSTSGVDPLSTLSVLTDLLTKHDDKDGFFVSQGKLNEFFSKILAGVNFGDKNASEKAMTISSNLKAYLATTPQSLNTGTADTSLATALSPGVGSPQSDSLMKSMLNISLMPAAPESLGAASSTVPLPPNASPLAAKLDSLIKKYQLDKGEFIEYADVMKWSIEDKQALADAFGVSMESMCRSKTSFSQSIAGFQSMHSDMKLGSNNSGTRLDMVDGLLGVKTLSAALLHQESQPQLLQFNEQALQALWGEMKQDDKMPPEQFIQKAAEIMANGDTTKIELIKTALSWLNGEYGILNLQSFEEFKRFTPTEALLNMIKNDKETFNNIRYSELSSDALRFVYNTKQAYQQTFNEARSALHIDNELSDVFFAAVIKAESAGQTDAVSNKGAAGLMQVIPSTAVNQAKKILEETNDGATLTPELASKLRALSGGNLEMRKDAQVSIFIGMHYYNENYHQLKQDHPNWDADKLMSFTLASYNAGPNGSGVQSGNFTALPAETQNYISKIMGMVRSDVMRDMLNDGANVDQILHRNVKTGGMSGYGLSVNNVNLDDFDARSQVLIRRAQDHVGTQYVRDGVHDCYDFATGISSVGEKHFSNLNDVRGKIEHHQMEVGTAIETHHSSMNGTGSSHWGVLVYSRSGQPYILNFNGTGKEALTPLDMFFRNVDSNNSGVVNYRSVN